MDQLTYQQLLAEQYEENARNLLTFQEEGNDEGEEIESYTEDDYVEKYDDMNLKDTEDFNRFQPRHELPNVIKPEQRNDLNLKRNTNVRNLVLNIDGQFRGNIVPGETFQCTGTVNTGTKTTGTTSSEFTFMGSRLYKNVVSIKLTSCEFHNVFYTFSRERGNISFTVFDTATSTTYDVTLPVTDGANYATPQLLQAAINAGILTAGVPVPFTCNYNADEHQFSFTGLSCTITFPTTTNNPNGNGIGYNLGFLYKSYTSGLFTAITAEGAPDIVQDRYVYLDINKWNVVEHQQYGQTFFPVFAKLQLNQPKNATVFTGNYIDSSTKEYYFQQPENLQRFDIRILDAYGNVLNMRNANISITLEVKETYDFPSYEKVRALM